MKENDDIEILDLFEDKNEFDTDVLLVKKANKEVKEKSEDNKKVDHKEDVPKKRNKTTGKTKAIQIVFCSLSALFILGCCIFYGSRLIKYYKIYNPSTLNGEKVLLLSNKIGGYSEIVYEGDGLYIQGGNYIYKGNVSNNYLKYNNLLWRIVKINSDGTMQIILDDYINILNWNSEAGEYSTSLINNYLNDYFVKSLDKDLLVKANYCTDIIDDLSNITCDGQNSDYVTLLDVTSYLNSVIDKDTYLSSEEEIFWLNNYGSEKIWHTNGSNVSQSEANSFYEIRPVVTLKSTIPYTSGDGTKENPYITTTENKLTIGSIVKLGEDNWVVYENNEVIKLTSIDVIDKQYRFDMKNVLFNLESESSIAKYLNETYLEELPYKDLLQDTEWYVGTLQESYLDVKSEKVNAKVGLLNIMDIKIDSSVSGYYLSTGNTEGYVYAYENVLKQSKPTLYRNIRPCIALDKNINLIGEGTIDSPFEVEE